MAQDKIDMKKNSRCYLCAGKAFKKRSGSVRDMPELDVLECESCGLTFLSSSDHIRDGFYESSSMHGEESVDVLKWQKETAWDDERRFRYTESLLANRDILDFGCGTGGFLLKARELASSAHGVEAETGLAAHFERNNLQVFQRLPGAQERIENGYHLITMFHVLEHLKDPKSILAELGEFLSDDGELIIETPNADDALLTLYNNDDFARFSYWSCHLFLYTVKTLEMLFKQLNLKINYIKQVQRYPLANHLLWLARGEPGGHIRWSFLDSPDLQNSYEKQLAAIGKCDTLMASVAKR